jgi:endoglucanase Acf2
MNLKISFAIFLLSAGCSQAQETSVVPGGKGSYASFPPNPSKEVQNVLSRPLYVTEEAINQKRALPTNGWWTNLLVDKFSGQLWSFPHQIRANENGIEFFYPVKWNDEGRDPISDYPLKISGLDFKPQDARAKNWGDWTLTFRQAQSPEKYWDITLGRGMPYVWIECKNAAPIIQSGNDAKFFDVKNQAVQFPFSGEAIGLDYAGRKYGIFAPDNTRFSLNGDKLNTEFTGEKTYLVIAPLPSANDLAAFHQHAYAIPRDSKMNWLYQPEKAQVTTGWHLTTEPLKGTEKRLIQGWLPHHWRDTIHNLKFNSLQYRTPRGAMKTAIGTDFRVIYSFNGIPPMLPAPEKTGLPHDFDATRMKDYLTRYATRKEYGEDTYWGGKHLLQMAQYMMAARALNDPSFETLRNNLKAALTDWFSYAPGEKAHYFARYPKWKALVGFNTSYGSEAFNDHHFHYGYFTTASALLGLVDPQWLKDYGPMARLVAKEYASFERDEEFPHLRTFDVWEGHSWAGGFSSPTGNNQESSSEAVQSWAGIFLLGQALGDDKMTAAGAMGYAMETRAIMEYWFNIHGDNFSSNYKQPIVGMVWSGGQLFGTYFSGDPAWVYAIQWLPMSPALDYLNRDPIWAKKSFETMLKLRKEKEGKAEIEDLGPALGNVVLAYQGQFDSDNVAAKLDELWEKNSPIARDNDTPGLTYYGTHSRRNLGEIQWNYHLDLPLSRVYFNPRRKIWSYVVYNPADKVQKVTVYKDSTPIGFVDAAPHKLTMAHQLKPLTAK